MTPAHRWLAVVFAMPLTACTASADAPDAGSRRLDASGGDGAGDASPRAELSCLGKPPPAPVADPIEIDGRVFTVEDLAVEPLAAAEITVRRRGDGASVATATTDSEGRFALSLADDDADVTFRVDASGRLPTTAWPPGPMNGGEGDVLLLAVDIDEISAWYAASGQAYTGQRTLLSAVVDCNLDPIGRSQVRVDPAPAAIAYWNQPARQWEPDAATDGSNGFSLAMGVDSKASITATLLDQRVPLPPRPVTAGDGELTLQLVSPHGQR